MAKSSGVSDGDFRDGCIDLGFNSEGALQGFAFKEKDAAVDAIAWGEGNGFDFNFARFDFREVENIVDQGH